MKTFSRLALPVATAAAFFAFDMRLEPAMVTAPAGDPALSVSLVTPAAAQTVRAQSRRVARRTARRTTRRQSYIRSLPGGCAWRPPYHYCGGVYYSEVVQDGATVYIVVNP
ncbi:MAG: hypothetical protein AAFQ88_10085 [Pseudomonadota bacterium]